jgi:hypothetical protein
MIAFMIEYPAIPGTIGILIALALHIAVHCGCNDY